mmetsp:Transcript_43296/g.124981  ORF Transcript_43296/g.124981 Transcript_43296/m.124981 type:complete len:292 (+) Transcript_43296:67-942(+)
MATPGRVSAALALVGAFGSSRAFVSTPQAATLNKHLRVTAAANAASDTGAATDRAAGSSLFSAASLGCVAAAIGAAAVRRTKTACRAESGAEMAASIPRPEDLLESPKFPLFMGSTGGYMSRATRERHAITWTSKEERQFEMPTGGYAIMNKGENLCYFRRKEACISLGKQLRKMKIENYKIYRLKKDGTVIFLHPADGVFPEKVNKGRVQVNGRPFTVGQNAQPGLLKWTKYHMKTYEADPLSTMFVKARLNAWSDQENLFPIPQPDDLDNEDLLPKGYADRVKALWKSL